MIGLIEKTTWRDFCAKDFSLPKDQSMYFNATLMVVLNSPKRGTIQAFFTSKV